LTVRRDLGEMDLRTGHTFGISPQSPHMVISFEGERIRLVLGMSHPIVKQQYIYIEPIGRLYLTDNTAQTLFLWKPEDFRDRAVIPYDQEDIRNIVIKWTKRAPLIFQKEENDWYVKEKGKEEYLCDSGFWAARPKALAA